VRAPKRDVYCHENTGDCQRLPSKLGIEVAIARKSGVRDIRAFAKRVHSRWLQYRRRYPGMSVPISDTLSRILEHEPEYRPLRPRSPVRRRPALQNPGIFTVQEIADALETTVGDLLGEPPHAPIRDLVSRTDRQKLRDAVTLLRDLFDLDDETLAEPSSAAEEAAPFLVSAADFIPRDHDYPAPLHVWVVPEGTSIRDVQSIREVHDPRFQVVRVLGDSMEPELRDGWKVLVDTEQTTPQLHALVAVYIRDQGGFFGRWERDGETIRLRRANPAASPVILTPEEDWTVWGTVTTIVEAPIETRERHDIIVPAAARARH
jgi:hypothetical protein